MLKRLHVQGFKNLLWEFMADHPEPGSRITDERTPRDARLRASSAGMNSESSSMGRASSAKLASTSGIAGASIPASRATAFLALSDAI